ncbi:MAG TPA: vWA domain-containing protein [Phycisphaerales bacterium]|nr:vWA domain-containing protein [Phycisphaerales bacterium]
MNRRLVRPVLSCLAAASLAILAGRTNAGGEHCRVIAECPPPVDPSGDPGPVVDRAPEVRIALLLDTSNSMDGLIAQAKAQLWSVVNEFQHCERDGKKPELRIALYEYGNNSISSGTRWVRQVMPFTTDLDLLSERLFALTTNGGQEYCGEAIQRSTAELAWRNCPGDLNMIVIAGNEPFTQGTTHYAEAIADAVRRNIRVHTVFCGSRSEGIETKWQDGAVLGRGGYTAIDHTKDVPDCRTPFDDEMTRLGSEINTTYLPYGDTGAEGAARQMEMDRKVMAARPASAPDRAAAKGGSAYRNENWDLVDAIKEKRVDLDALQDAELPPAMQTLPKDRRAKYVEEMAARRAEIARRLQELGQKRAEFVRRQAKDDGRVTLGDALVAEIRKQASETGYTFKE